MSTKESNIIPFTYFKYISLFFSILLYVYTILVAPKLCPCKYIFLYPNCNAYPIAPRSYLSFHVFVLKLVLFLFSLCLYIHLKLLHQLKYNIINKFLSIIKIAEKLN